MFHLQFSHLISKDRSSEECVPLALSIDLQLLRSFGYLASQLAIEINITTLTCSKFSNSLPGKAYVALDWRIGDTNEVGCFFYCCDLVNGYYAQLPLLQNANYKSNVVKTEKTKLCCQYCFSALFYKKHLEFHAIQQKQKLEFDDINCLLIKFNKTLEWRENLSILPLIL